MALEIKKQDRETSQNLIRRFSRRVTQSGILLQARKLRYRKKSKSRQMKKRAAYKVCGIITTILVLSVLSIALLGNVGQGQETQSSDPVFIIVG